MHSACRETRCRGFIRDERKARFRTTREFGSGSPTGCFNIKCNYWPPYICVNRLSSCQNCGERSSEQRHCDVTTSASCSCCWSFAITDIIRSTWGFFYLLSVQVLYFRTVCMHTFKRHTHTRAHPHTPTHRQTQTRCSDHSNEAHPLPICCTPPVEIFILNLQ